MSLASVVFSSLATYKDVFVWCLQQVFSLQPVPGRETGIPYIQENGELCWDKPRRKQSWNLDSLSKNINRLQRKERKQPHAPQEVSIQERVFKHWVLGTNIYFRKILEWYWADLKPVFADTKVWNISAYFPYLSPSSVTGFSSWQGWIRGELLGEVKLKRAESTNPAQLCFQHVKKRQYLASPNKTHCPEKGYLGEQKPCDKC